MSIYNFYRYFLIIFLFTFAAPNLFAQKRSAEELAREKELIKTLEDSLTNHSLKFASAGKVRVKNFVISNDGKKQIQISCNETLSYLPLRPNNVESIYALATSVLSKEYPDYTLTITSDGLELSSMIPGIYSKSGKSSFERFTVNTTENPLVKRLSAPNQVSLGLQNRHIAVWQSHGRYYNQTQQRWLWQRPVLFQTVEDLFTQAFILPFLVPMLENAGANVLLPRERDTQLNEVIVDNDKNTQRSDFDTRGNAWKKGVLSGFANLSKEYKEKENPFQMGSFLQNTTVRDSNNASSASWIPDIPEKGNYAVYVAYKSLPNSTRDARYTVNHAGGSTEFSVNQTMGGGTWIYLGNFEFEKGKDSDIGVVLTTFSNDANKIVTADAVKIGGGMGNISRKRANQIVKTTVGKGRNRRTVTSTKEYSNYSTSGFPRFTEGARYWLQWAGAPDSVYSRTEYTNDYSDDFQSRGFWVNYIAGGSSVLPRQDGLRIPLDLAFAMHSDAGVNKNDSIIGTLAIYTVVNSDKKTTYANGISRRNARELTDLIQTQIVDDIRATYRKDWNRRGLWNKNYSESRVGEVPTMLLELLSHQNFADIRYGLDPRFRFVVSRAVYKAMLRYIAVTNNLDYVIQPLPVDKFSSRFTSKNEVELSWEPRIDKLEPTAKADAYIVYTRVDDGGFDNGVLVSNNKHRVKITTGKIYSFKVEAVNRGGRSFPSETLALYRDTSEKPPVLIVNGFTRISGPQSFTEGNKLAGFNDSFDAGVPYLSDISFTGSQTIFNRDQRYIDDVNPGHGASQTNYQDKEIAGNSFDYPYLHGRAIKAAGYSFASCSRAAIENGLVKLNEYRVVDLILGKEKQTVNPMDSTKSDYKALPRNLRVALENYLHDGGNLFVSGSHVISDLVLSKNSTNLDKKFVENMLKVEWTAQKYSNVSEVNYTSSEFNDNPSGHKFSFHTSPNLISYFVESPDVINPNGRNVIKILDYSENKQAAGTIYKGKYGVCVLGFPFETITNEKSRETLMEQILNYFK